MGFFNLLRSTMRIGGPYGWLGRSKQGHDLRTLCYAEPPDNFSVSVLHSLDRSRFIAGDSVACLHIQQSPGFEASVFTAKFPLSMT